MHHHCYAQISQILTIVYLRSFCQIASDFHSFGYPNSAIVWTKIVSLDSNPHPRGPSFCV
jgi:hypothetical protein